MTYDDLIVISSLVPRVLSLPPSRSPEGGKERTLGARLERGLWDRGWSLFFFDGVFELWVFESSPETRSKNKTTRESVCFKA